MNIAHTWSYLASPSPEALKCSRITFNGTSSTSVISSAGEHKKRTYATRDHQSFARVAPVRGRLEANERARDLNGIRWISCFSLGACVRASANSLYKLTNVSCLMDCARAAFNMRPRARTSGANPKPRDKSPTRALD